MIPMITTRVCREEGQPDRALACGELPLRECLLSDSGFAQARGGQDPLKDARDLGAAHGAADLSWQTDPYGHYMGRVNDAGACGVATVQGDSTAVSVRSISLAVSDLAGSVRSRITTAWDNAWAMAAEVWTMSPSDLRRLVGG
jgi:hypothetical protein